MSGRHEAFFRAQRERDDREQERREYNAMEEKVSEQSHRIDGLDAMLRQARVWSEEKDQRIEELEQIIEQKDDLRDRRIGELEAEREQLRAEISQYEWLLTQAKTRARDSFRWPGELEGANKSHPNAQTGQAEGGDVTR